MIHSHQKFLNWSIRSPQLAAMTRTWQLQSNPSGRRRPREAETLPAERETFCSLKQKNLSQVSQDVSCCRKTAGERWTRVRENSSPRGTTLISIAVVLRLPAEAIDRLVPALWLNIQIKSRAHSEVCSYIFIQEINGSLDRWGSFLNVTDSFKHPNIQNIRKEKLMDASEQRGKTRSKTCRRAADAAGSRL